MIGYSYHFLDQYTNLRSHVSELIDEFCSGNIGMIIDLQFLVDLNFGFDNLLVVGIGKLELVLGTVIWNILDEDYLVIVHA